MQHRHLAPESLTGTLTAAAIDDIITRGAMADWIALRDRVRADRDLAHRTASLARAAMEDERDIRRRFWADYADRYAG